MWCLHLHLLMIVQIKEKKFKKVRENHWNLFTYNEWQVVLEGRHWLDMFCMDRYATFFEIRTMRLSLLLQAIAVGCGLLDFSSFLLWPWWTYLETCIGWIYSQIGQILQLNHYIVANIQIYSNSVRSGGPYGWWHHMVAVSGWFLRLFNWIVCFYAWTFDFIRALGLY